VASAEAEEVRSGSIHASPLALVERGWGIRPRLVALLLLVSRKRAAPPWRLCRPWPLRPSQAAGSALREEKEEEDVIPWGARI